MDWLPAQERRETAATSETRMIADLLQLDGCEPGIGFGRAERRAAVMDLESQIRTYRSALQQPRALRDRVWAKTLRKAIKCAHYDALALMELEAA